MNRLFVSFATLMIFGMPEAMAVPEVVLSNNADSKILNVEVDADRGHTSVFSHGADLWVVFSSRDNAKIVLPKEIRSMYNIDAQESLNSSQGSGIRLSFAEKAPKFNITYKRMQGESDEEDVSILSDDEGLTLESFDDARFVNVYSTALNQNYTVLPMSGLSASTGNHFGDIRQKKAFSGLVFTERKGAPLRTVFSGGRYHLAKDMQNLVDLSKKYTKILPKVEKVEKIASVTTPLAAEHALEISNPTPTEDLSNNKSRIILLDKNAQPTPIPQEEIVLKSDSFAAVKPVGGVFANETPKIDLATNNVKSEPSLLSRILKDTPKEEAVTPEPIKLNTAWGKDLKIVSEATSATPEVDIILNEDLTEAMSVINGALTSLKGIYDPATKVKYAKPVEEKAEEQPEKTSVEDDANSGSLFGEDVASTDDYADAEPLNDADLMALAEETLNNSDVDTFDMDETEELIVTLEEGPLFFPVPEEPELSRAKIGELHEDTYLYKHNKIMERLGQSFSRVKRDRVRLQLAKLALAYNRGNETLSYIDYMPRLASNPALPEAEDARILAGVANIMLHRPTEGLAFINEATTNYETDRKLWQAVAYEALEDDPLALKLFKETIHQTKDYPYPLVKEVYLAYGRVLLRLERLTELNDLMKSLARQSPKSKLPAEGLLLMARANALENNDSATENLLAQAAASDHKEIAFLAQYEFVRFLFSKGDITIKQAIEHMERLRFLWRGDDLEEEILYKLGRMYLARGEQRKGLERLKQHNVHYPSSERVEDTTKLMISAFRELFLEDTLDSKLDELGLLGVYYDYRELTPPGKTGDNLIANIAQRLRNLGLFERSAKILEQQLEYRAKNVIERAQIGLRLADLYRLDEEYDEALNALIRTESPDIGDALQVERVLKESEILFDEKLYDEAHKVLDGMKDERATELRADIAWQQGQYNAIISELEPLFDRPENLPKNWDIKENVGFVRLAVAYNIMDRTRDLEDLKRRYKVELKQNPKLAKVTDFLLRELGSNQIVLGDTIEGVWPKLTEAFDIYHSFSESYDAIRDEREAEKVERKIFNRRMRQMSAPPRL